MLTPAPTVGGRNAVRSGRAAVRFVGVPVVGIVQVVCALLFCLWLTGCTSAGVDATARVAESGGREPSALERLLAADNGLLVRRWIVRDDSVAVREALEEVGVPLPQDDPRGEALHRNGFLLSRVPASSFERFGEALGDRLTDVQVWHGQAPQWRDAQEANLARSSVATVIDGRIRVFRGGTLNLLLRAWTVPLEVGAYLQLELVPQYVAPGSTSLRRLLGENEVGGELFKDLYLELELVPGEVWVLTGAAPTVSGVGEPGGKGPPAVGPDVLPPQTLGQLLFVDAMADVRTILIFEAVLPGSVTTTPVDTLGTPEPTGGDIDTGAEPFPGPDGAAEPEPSPFDVTPPEPVQPFTSDPLNSPGIPPTDDPPPLPPPLSSSASTGSITSPGLSSHRTSLT